MTLPGNFFFQWLKQASMETKVGSLCELIRIWSQPQVAIRGARGGSCSGVIRQPFHVLATVNQIGVRGIQRC